MFTDRVIRQKFKNILVILNGILGLVFLAIVFYGLFEVRPKVIAKAIELGHYHKFHTRNLPNSQNKIRHDEEIDKNVKPSAPTHATVSNDEPKIAILLTNLGLNQNATELAISLPEEISLGFLPYVTNLKPLWHKAAELKHELYIYLPFETQKYPADSPGHLPLLLNLSDEENIRRMHTLLNPFKGYVGVYSSYKEVFTTDAIKSAPIIEELKKRNLKLFIGRPTEMKFDHKAAIHKISADIILDTEPNIVSIKNNLDKLIEIAEKNKSAVAYAEGYPVTIYTLKAWLPILKKKGIKLVPVSHIIEN